MRNVVVIGGGVSGLAAAYYIKKYSKESGIDATVTVMEKEKRIGGKVLTDKLNGFLVEGGPDSVSTARQPFMDLCTELGIGAHMIAPRAEGTGSFLFLGGRLRRLPKSMTLMLPTSIAPLISTDIISPAGKIRAAMEVMVPRHNAAQDESAAGFVRRRFGREVYEKMAEPLLGGIHAGNPEHTSLECAFPMLAEMEARSRSLVLAMSARGGGSGGRARMASFAGGMSELTSALAAAVGPGNIHTGSPVSEVSRSREPGGKEGYEVRIWGGQSIAADVVVLAAPAYAAAGMISGMDSEMAGALSSIKYTSLVVVSIAYSTSDVPDGMRGSGFLIPHIEGRKASAVTWCSAKWDGRAPEGSALVRCYFSDAYTDAYVSLGDGALTGAAREELEASMGMRGAPLFSKVQRWERGLPQYTIGHMEKLNLLERRLAVHAGIFMVGAWQTGTGVPNCIEASMRAAKKVIEYLKTQK